MAWHVVTTHLLWVRVAPLCSFPFKRLSVSWRFLLRLQVHDILAFVIVKSKYLTRFSLADLFMIALNWKQPSTPTNECVNKLWPTCSKALGPAVNGSRQLTCTAAGVICNARMLSEKPDTKEYIPCDSTYLWHY